MKERWKIIEEFPKYLISNKGRIKTINTLEDKKIFTKEDGYVATGLTKNKKEHYKYVHRLVAEAFVSNPNNKGQVNHKNGIKNDNSVENLEWATPSENIRHAIETGLLKYKKKGKEIKNRKFVQGEKVHNSKATVEQVIEIRVLYETGEYKQSELAERFDLNYNMIYNIVNRNTYKHIN